MVKSQFDLLEKSIRMEDKIILLDLNQTLASKISMDLKNFSYDVSQDEYRQDLVAAIKDKRIFLITARTSDYEQETIEKIKKDTDLKIERFYFKPISMKYKKVSQFKKEVALKLFEEGFKPEGFYGIESNSETRENYASIGVESFPYADYMQKYTKMVK